MTIEENEELKKCFMLVLATLYESGKRMKNIARGKCWKRKNLNIIGTKKQSKSQYESKPNLLTL